MSSKSRKFVESSRSVNFKIDAATQKLDSDTLGGHSANYFATVSSPIFTGTPIAPTATTGTNTTQIATTAFVRGEVAALVNSAPTTLDTLSELATALGNDPNFATTISSSIGTKANFSISIAAGTGLSGGGDLSENRILSLASSGVTPNTYGSSTSIPVLTIDTYGRVTSANTSSVSIPSGSLTFTGDVTGTGTTGSSTTLTLANSGVTAGSYGSATDIPAITVDAKGRVTSISTNNVSIPSGSLTFTGDVTGSGTTGSSTTLTLANSGVTAGSYKSVTVDDKGRVTAGSNPTTLSGYGITDAVGSSDSRLTNTRNTTNTITFTTTGGAASGITFDGSAARIIDYSTLGAAPASHTHSYQAADADLLAIAGLTGTSGFLKKTAADTWTLDTNTYLTGITSSQVTTALGFTPYNSTNPSGYTSNLGTVTSVTGTDPVVSSGGTTPAISMAAATASVNGYMTSTYAAKLDGIAAGATNVTNTNQLTNGAGFITSSGSITGSSASCTGNAATTTHNASRTDSTAYPVVWASGSNSPMYSCAAVTITSSTGALTASKIYNAVYNDIADFVELETPLEKIEYGKCYVYINNKAETSSEKCQKGIIGIASDTYGYGLGTKKLDEGYEIPIAVAGFVLAYIEEPETLESGDPLTSSAEGFLKKISDEDKIKYPERIVATFFRKEKAVLWHDIVVNNRHWVKVK